MFDPLRPGSRREYDDLSLSKTADNNYQEGTADIEERVCALL